MQFIEYILQLLTLSVAWTFAAAQPNERGNSNNDDDFDPQDFEEAQVNVTFNITKIWI